MASKRNQNWWLMCVLMSVITLALWRHVCYLINGSDEFTTSFFIRSKTGFKETVQIKELEPNCGMRQACPFNSFSIFLSTGVFPENTPRLCINGKHLMKAVDRGEGRGLNAAVVEPEHFDVISFRNFDTYLWNKSEEISEWVDGISSEHIIIMFTYDEASTKLGGETKSLLNELGSGKIQNLQFRSQWYMITQKESKGFTTYEKITYSKKKNWGDKIEFRGCIPKKIPKKITTADEPLKENKRRVNFCEGKKEQKYKGFCNEARFEIIMPALLTNRSLVGNAVYNLPIYLYAGSDLELLIASLDSLIHQPGIQVSMVTILYEKNAQDVIDLAKIYGMKSNQTKIPANFGEKINECREIAMKNTPTVKHLIVMDENVIPSPDFLYFMAQIYPVLEKDEEVSTISGWSPNCYKEEGNVHLVYRIRGYPRYATLTSVTPDNSFYKEIFAPDVARVQGPEACHMPSLEPGNWIERPQDLLKNRYFHKMIMLQQLSQEVEADKILNSCSESAIKNETNAIYVEEDEESLKKILKCLGVVGNQYGEYEGIIRLFLKGFTEKMSEDKLDYNCRMALSKDYAKTSNQIGLAYSPVRTVKYDKLPFPKLPVIRMNKDYKPGFIYTPHDGLKTTYNETYHVPIAGQNVNSLPSKLLKQHREYSKLGRSAMPMTSGLTEYKAEFPIKHITKATKGESIEQETTCPMVTTGRDERDPLPLTKNYNKHLDIYLSTSRLAHRAFTLQEQRTIAMKDVVTSQETMDIPKGRGFGCKFPAFPGQDLDNRDRNMVDKALFHTEAKLRYIPKGMPKVPNFGSESETQSAYQKPEGYAVPRIFARFVDYPGTIGAPTAKQTLCPPGMYTTESYAINNHCSPQAVV